MCWVDLSMVTTTLAAAGTVPISKATTNGTRWRIAALPVRLRGLSSRLDTRNRPDGCTGGRKVDFHYNRESGISRCTAGLLRRTVNDIKQAGDLLRGFGRGDVFELERIFERLFESAHLADLQPGLGIELLDRALRDRARHLHVLGEAVDRARVAVGPVDSARVGLHEANDGVALLRERRRAGDVDADGLSGEFRQVGDARHDHGLAVGDVLQPERQHRPAD